MSKQRKTGDVKDNNISSKLLGANLSDINIEKFRDLSQYRKERYDLGGQITLPMLKSLSNKFSAEVILTVILPGQALGNIDALAECVNLMVLNLSKNSIENIGPLKKMKKLRIVDLSENCLTGVDPLHNCQELVNLKLQGNMIKGLDQLRAVKTCPNLRNLSLQALGGDNDNPICQLNGYRSNIFG
jgi:Leucine-rich repeat (LRR) protein